MTTRTRRGIAGLALSVACLVLFFLPVSRTLVQENPATRQARVRVVTLGLPVSPWMVHRTATSRREGVVGESLSYPPSLSWVLPPLALGLGLAGAYLFLTGGEIPGRRRV